LKELEELTKKADQDLIRKDLKLFAEETEKFME